MRFHVKNETKMKCHLSGVVCAREQASDMAELTHQLIRNLSFDVCAWYEMK